MRANLGWFTRRGFFAGVLLCVSLGILIYSQFDFTQQSKQDDVTASRINALEKELNTTRARMEVLEKRMDETQAKLAALSPKRAVVSGKH
jgi:uncharacterized protein YlxW (UPF0749 family)